MPNESEGQALIEEFFAALHLRHLDRCSSLLRALERIARKRGAFKPWSLYLKGILVFEADHNWSRAERIFAKLLETELDPALHSRVLLALGRSLDIQGRWEEAIAAFEQSLSVFTGDGQTIQTVKVWKEIAISYRRGFAQGDFGLEALQRAITYCQLALDALEPMTDPAPDIVWLKGSVWNTLGAIYMNLGQWDQALACYQHDLAICRSLDDRHGIGISYLNLGEIYQQLGQTGWPDALEAYQHALSLFREFQNPYLEADVLANLALLHEEMGDYESALDDYHLAIERIETLRAGLAAEQARAGFFATVADTYANAVLLCLAAGRSDQAFDYAERARARAFLDGLAARSPALSAQMAAVPMILAEVQAVLPAEALLLAYFTTGLVEAGAERPMPSPGPQRHRFPPSRTLIFAVTRDAIQVHDAGLSPNDLRPSQLDSVVERHFLEPQIRRTLYDRLIAPVEPLIRSRRRLYVVPHGPLHYIPFQALIASDGETLLRKDGPQLVYGPSATVLLRYGQAVPGRAPQSCLALGYNGSGRRRLRFAEEEARGMARLMGGRVLAGPALKKAVLYAQAAGYRLLHFSCHGAFDPESPLSSALHLARGETLTALDILDHLRLHCDLVTLSACESGLSRVRRGDELVGLMRAFLYAGAPALLCTLWRVDERSTRILMETFYQEVRAGTGFAEALQRAQLYLRNLTRKQARELLVHFMTDELLGHASQANEQPPAPLPPPVVARRAAAYLKGVLAKGRRVHDATLHEGADDERVFADPFYWAPFVLIGDRS